MQIPLDGARILVAGATGGMGRAVACELAERGAVLALAARRGERLADPTLPEGTRVPIDLAAAGAPALAVREAHRLLGGLDGVVCAAGAVAFGPLAETPAEVVEEIVRLDLLVPLLLAQAAIPVLERGGFVANVSGVVAETPVAGLVAYSAAKAGISAGFRALAREARPAGITVLDLRPPHTETGLAGRPLHGTAPRLPVGLEPDVVARRIVEAIERGEREVAAAGFA
jgi:NAD(P)-dependent dehydrogenase (short-subunit alcohol dehydrogenase family)